MNRVCEGCAHFGVDYRTNNEPACLKASYTDNMDGFGFHKLGAVCIHDTGFVGNQFEPKTGEETHLRGLAQKARRLEEDAARLRDENRVLKERLTRIE